MGNIKVYGLTSDPSQGVFCRRAQLRCNGVHACCERYELDENTMRELWSKELDTNEDEEASALGILARSPLILHQGSMPGSSLPNLKCPVTEFLFLFLFEIYQQYQHLYWPITANIDEDVLRFAIQNNGLLPPGFATLATEHKCVLTVHPRVGLKTRPQSTETLYNGGRVLEKISPAFSDNHKYGTLLALKKERNIVEWDGMGWMVTIQILLLLKYLLVFLSCRFYHFHAGTGVGLED
ncbi:hypothetical protein C8J57DRAFT_1213008 [Mycena rebaudengoi]|nr:hypothetical protein C8J57DRAFT_1213008 [Mycena rebaudengoi]